MNSSDATSIKFLYYFEESRGHYNKINLKEDFCSFLNILNFTKFLSDDDLCEKPESYLIFNFRNGNGESKGFLDKLSGGY